MGMAASGRGRGGDLVVELELLAARSMGNDGDLRARRQRSSRESSSMKEKGAGSSDWSRGDAVVGVGVLGRAVARCAGTGGAAWLWGCRRAAGDRREEV